MFFAAAFPYDNNSYTMSAFEKTTSNCLLNDNASASHTINSMSGYYSCAIFIMLCELSTPIPIFSQYNT